MKKEREAGGGGGVLGLQEAQKRGSELLVRLLLLLLLLYMQRARRQIANSIEQQTEAHRGEAWKEREREGRGNHTYTRNEGKEGVDGAHQIQRKTQSKQNREKK